MSYGKPTSPGLELTVDSSVSRHILSYYIAVITVEIGLVQTFAVTIEKSQSEKVYCPEKTS